MAALAIINQTAPYGSGDASESIDLAMVCGTFGQEVSLFYLGDGVFQLLKSQQPTEKGIRNLSKVIKSLPFFDVEKLYVCEKSLINRGLHTDLLCTDVILLNESSLSEKLATHTRIMVF